MQDEQSLHLQLQLWHSQLDVHIQPKQKSLQSDEGYMGRTVAQMRQSKLLHVDGSIFLGSRNRSDACSCLAEPRAMSGFTQAKTRQDAQFLLTCSTGSSAK